MAAWPNGRVNEMCIESADERGQHARVWCTNAEITSRPSSCLDEGDFLQTHLTVSPWSRTSSIDTIREIPVENIKEE